MSISSTRYYPYALDNTAGRQTVSDLSNDHIQFGVGISSDFKITGVTTFTGSITLNSSLIDVKGQVGSAGSILASTGSGVDWISPSTTSVDNATKVGTNLNATDADQWVAFLGASSGNNPIRVDNALRYNPVGAQGVLKVDGDILVESGIGGGSHRRTQIAPGAIDLARENPSIDFKTGVAEDFDCRIIQNSNGLDFLTGGDGNTSTVLSLTANKEVQLKHVGNEKLITTSTGITVTGTATVDGVHLGDDDKITLGNSPSDADLEIFHSTSSGGFSVIRDIGAGQLVIGGSAIEFKSADIGTSWTVIDSSGIKVNTGKIDATNIEISGTLQDGESTPSVGTSGQVLSSTSTSVKWVNAGDLAAGAASQVAITNDNDDAAERFVLFCDSATGNQSIKSDATFKFNPSTNALTANTFIGALSGNASTATVATNAQGLTGTPSISITNLTISGSITDKDSSTGSSGQVLSSTGSQVDWVNVGSLAAGSASQVAISDNSTDASQFVNFTVAKSGNNAIRANDSLRYNPSNGTLSATTFSGSATDSTKLPLAGGTLTGNLTIEDNVLRVGDFSNDNYLEIKQLTTDGFGFSFEHDNASCLLNEQGTTNQALVLGDNNHDNAGTLFGISIKQVGVAGDAYVPRLTLTGAGDLSFAGTITVSSSLKDKDGDTGTSGQVLSSTGSQVNWVNVGSLAAGSASQVAISDDSNANQSRFVTFVDSSTGNNAVKSDGQLKYNPSSNQLTAGSFSGSMAASNVDSGTLGTARIPDLAASKITSGTFADARIPSLAASKITSGTISDSRLPSSISSDITGNAATSTKAFVTESDTDSVDRGIVFCDAANNASGNKDLKYDRNLLYNANLNRLVATTFQGTNGNFTNVDGAIKIRTDNGDAYHNILFVDSTTDNQYQTIKMDDEVSRLQWNPNDENLLAFTTQTQGLRQWSDGSLGSSGQVLTSGGSGSEWSWQSISQGKVLKYQTMNDSTARTFSANTWSNCGLSITYTPASSSSIILITAYINIWGKSPADSAVTSRGDAYMRIMEGNNVLGEQQYCTWGLSHSSTYQHYVTEKMWQFTFYREHTNNNTNSRTYKMMLYEETGILQMNDGPGSNDDGSSYFTIMEIAT